MASTYEFIDNGKSLGINFNGQGYTAGKNFVELTIPNLSDNNTLRIRSNSASPTEFQVNVGVDTITGVGAGSATATALRDALEAIFFLDDTGGGGGIPDAPNDGVQYGRENQSWTPIDIVVVSDSTPPTDVSKLWHNITDNIIYFNDGSDWVSEQLFEILFNEQGTTPNNTWFRSGNTTGNDLGNGYNMGFDAKIQGLSFNRQPSTAQAGNFWLYSNQFTGTDNASVVTTFSVDNSGRGVLQPNTPTTIDNGKYISMRWSGNQTNNNVCVLKVRKKYV